MSEIVDPIVVTPGKELETPEFFKKDIERISGEVFDKKIVNVPSGTKWYKHRISFRGIRPYASESIVVYTTYGQQITDATSLLKLLTSSIAGAVSINSKEYPFIVEEQFRSAFNNISYGGSPAFVLASEVYRLLSIPPSTLAYVHDTLTTDGSTISVTTTTDTTCSLTSISDTVTEL